MEKMALSFDDIQDMHLDGMLRLACKWADLVEAQRIIEECEKVVEIDFDIDEAYALFLKKLDAEERNARKVERAARRRKWLPRIIEIAACMVLMMGIATPIAIANVEMIRVKVMEMLINIQEEYTEISMVENVNEAFYVPSEWDGEYFPTYIPEGYELVEIDVLDKGLTYKNDEGEWLYYYERADEFIMRVDSEGENVSLEKINGWDAFVIEKKNGITITICMEDRYIVCETMEDRSETLEIAKNIEKISK